MAGSAAGCAAGDTWLRADPSCGCWGAHGQPGGWLAGRPCCSPRGHAASHFTHLCLLAARSFTVIYASNLLPVALCSL